MDVGGLCAIAARRPPTARSAAPSAAPRRDAIITKALPMEVAMVADEASFIGGVALTMTAITLLVRASQGGLGTKIAGIWFIFILFCILCQLFSRTTAQHLPHVGSLHTAVPRLTSHCTV